MTVCTTVYSATARTSEYSSFSFFNDKDDALRRRRSKTKHHHHIQQKHQERMSAKKKKKLSTTAMTSRRTGHQFSPLEEEKEIERVDVILLRRRIAQARWRQSLIQRRETTKIPRQKRRAASSPRIREDDVYGNDDGRSFFSK